LSIIDISGGTQPLPNEDRSVWITFNGEIYNFAELRRELEAKGHHFRTDSDTETIVHLYEEEGIDCLQRLCGMFAFAIWDRQRRRLFLARDRLGQKPLVYRHEQERLLFGSEIKSILQVPGVPRQMDLNALDEYLTYSYVPHPRTMFAGIRKLPPAHYAVFESNRLSIQRYWSPDLQRVTHLELDDIRGRLDDLLGESVRLRLRSDVPLGAFLSGGIDSTTIVGLMQRHLDRSAKTYTIGFPYSSHDETDFAQTAARHLKTDHHEMQVEPDSVSLLPTLVRHFDEPFADSSAIPTYYVAEMARRHVTVALTGDGGDELFAGYSRYQTVDRLGAFDRLPAAIRQLRANPLWQFLPHERQSSILTKLRFRMKILQQTPDRRYVNWVNCFNEDLRNQLYTPGVASQLSACKSEQFIAEAMGRSRRESPGTKAMHADLLTYLPGDLLTKVDITSMAHGLECRSPFLDHRVVELATTIPFKLAVGGNELKPLLTSTFAASIPRELRSRPKMGFSVPLAHWFRTDLSEMVNDLLLACGGRTHTYLRADAIRDLVDDHNSGRWDHSDRLWSLLFLESWHRMYIDSTDCLLPAQAHRDLTTNSISSTQ
jgi:asparagine synthase (glutamine-hydrolysing)